MIDLAYVMLLAALTLALVRLIRGPGLPDRVVALDLVAMIFAGLVAVYCIDSREPIYIDALLLLAGVFFFGTVAFARFLGTVSQESKSDD